jgi:hypothetical protein
MLPTDMSGKPSFQGFRMVGRSDRGFRMVFGGAGRFSTVGVGVSENM